MNDDRFGEGTFPLELEQEVDRLCDELEHDLNAAGGREEDVRRSIEDLLARVPDRARKFAIYRLLSVELEHRRACGLELRINTYEERFPDDLDAVTEAAGWTERAFSDTENHATTRERSTAGLQVKCPHCHNPLQIVPDSDLESLQCPCCGSDFSLVGDVTSTRAATSISNVGHFSLIERIGMGAFGVVWKARDNKLDRTVALKVPRQGQFDKQQEKLFIREAQNAAQLSHPGIVSVYEVGRAEDTLYIVSDYVRGVTLTDWLTCHKPTIEEATEICAKVAAALSHAHRRGVIHRDLKPGNIMIDENGEPRLMDFGLARRDVGEVTMTVDGQVLGTPAYMSPEQARGEAHIADQRSDIYSLGVVLFQLLTGELPFRGNVQMLIYQVIHETAPGPRQLNSRIPFDLDTICGRCLEKEPQKRYPTAAEFADDLNRFQRREPIAARPVGVVGRIWRWYTRNPRASLLAAGGYITCMMSILTVWGVIGSFFYAVGIVHAERPAVAILEIIVYATLLYLPGLVTGLLVLNGRFRAIWVSSLILVVGFILLIFLSEGIGPDSEIYRAAQNSDYIRYQLTTLLGTMVGLGLLLHGFALVNGWHLIGPKS